MTRQWMSQTLLLGGLAVTVAMVPPGFATDKSVVATKVTPKATAKVEKNVADKTPAKPDKKQVTAESPVPEKVQKKGKHAKADVEKTPDVVLDPKKLAPETLASLKKLDEDLKLENQRIQNELQSNQEDSVKDIAMLWQAAVERSGTIRYAIEKLSRRDATGKPVANDSFSKRMLQSLIQVGGMAGSVWTGTPAGVLGGNMIQELIQGNPMDPNLVRVTDADMLILAREVEALQTQLIESYYNYRDTQERWKLTQQAARAIENFKQVSNPQGATALSSIEMKAIEPIAESFVQTSLQEESTAKHAFVTARNNLGLLVGSDALVALEQLDQIKIDKEPAKKADATP